MAISADIPQTAILYILVSDIQRSVGNRSRHSSRLSGLQHLPSVVERATLIAHADMYYSTPSLCIGAFTSNIGKGDAYIHIPRTSTVASPLTTCLDLLDSDKPKTRRLKTPFLYVKIPFPPHASLCVSISGLARLILFVHFWICFIRLGMDFHSHLGSSRARLLMPNVHDFGNRV